MKKQGTENLSGITSCFKTFWSAAMLSLFLLTPALPAGEGKPPSPPDEILPQLNAAAFHVFLLSTAGKADEKIIIDKELLEKIKAAVGRKDLQPAAAASRELKRNQVAEIALGIYTVEFTVRKIAKRVKVSLSISTGKRKLVSKQIIDFGLNDPLVMPFKYPADGKIDVIVVQLVNVR